MLYLYTALVIYITSGFVFAEEASVTQISIACAYSALWIMICFLYSKKSKYSFSAMIVGFIPIAYFVLPNWYNRIKFVVEHGGMDCADCSASPLAFLIGVIFEVFIFLPGFVGLFIVYRVCVKNPKPDFSDPTV